MMERKHRARLCIYGLLTLAVMAAIFWFSSQNAEISQELSDSFLLTLIGRVLEKLLPRLSEKGMEFDIRKYAHMAEFFCLGITSLLFANEAFRNRRLFGSACAAFCFCFLYACTDEWHQLYVPGRAGRFTDVLVDAAGFTLAILFTGLILFAVNRRKKAR